MQSSISLGMEFVLSTQRLIKQTLCVLPLPLLKVFLDREGYWAWGQLMQLNVNSAQWWLLAAFPPLLEMKQGSLVYNISQVTSPGTVVLCWSTHLQVQNNEKIEWLCKALPGCESCASSSCQMQAESCLLLTSKPSSHLGIKGMEAIFSQQ